MHESKNPSPGAVNHVRRTQPHEHHEGEEVAMVEVTHTVEHPRWRQRVKEIMTHDMSGGGGGRRGGERGEDTTVMVHF